MKLNKMNRLFFGLVLVMAAASLSSCNRGYGCPTNFSLNDNVVKVVKVVKEIVITTIK